MGNKFEIIIFVFYLWAKEFWTPGAGDRKPLPPSDHWSTFYAFSIRSFVILFSLTTLKTFFKQMLLQ